MAVEASIFSPRRPLAVEELSAAAAADQLNIRFLDSEGMPLDPQPTGPLAGHFVVIGWTIAATETTAAVDAALRARDKDAVDDLGRSGKVAWCELSCRPFSYEAFWAKYPAEVEEYEESLKPETLAALKAATTRYQLRSGTRPARCGELLEVLPVLLKRESHGVVE